MRVGQVGHVVMLILGACITSSVHTAGLDAQFWYFCWDMIWSCCAICADTIRIEGKREKENKIKNSFFYCLHKFNVRCSGSVGCHTFLYIYCHWGRVEKYQIQIWFRAQMIVSWVWYLWFESVRIWLITWPNSWFRQWSPLILITTTLSWWAFPYAQSSLYNLIFNQPKRCHPLWLTTTIHRYLSLAKSNSDPLS